MALKGFCGKLVTKRPYLAMKLNRNRYRARPSKKGKGC
jgi:hypothetical protein